MTVDPHQARTVACCRLQMTVAVEDYLKAILRISSVEGNARTSVLAREVAVTPASASTMISRLHAAALVEPVGWGRIRLTGHGEAHARSVVRRHRLAEAMLHDLLGMRVEEVHENAEALEHAMSPALEELIDARLGRPSHDPHGSPIPPREDWGADSVQGGADR